MKKLHCTPSQHKTLLFLCFVLGIVFILLLNSVTLIHCISGNATTYDPVFTAAREPSPLAQQNLTLCSSHDTVNILLIGQDRREGEPRARADCMILCTFHPGDPVLTMTSFLRDLYVEIPGYAKNRINAAYAFGGMPLLRQTFQKNFGIAVDGCIEVDFCQFPTLIDLAGGITIDLRLDEAACINTEVPHSTLCEGSQRLNGAQALAYARIRDLDSDGDFSRTNRQRKILLALMDQCKSTGVSDLLPLLKKAADMISTDIRQRQLLSLITEVSPMLSRMEIVSQRIPIEGSYTHEIIDGMAVLAADLEANRAFLNSSLG